MNNETNLSLKIKNSITGSKKLEEYETRLKSINNVIKKMPKSLNIQTNTGFVDYSNQLDTIIQKLDQTTKRATQTGKSLTNIFNVSKLSAYTYTIKRATTAVMSYIDKSSSYLENINLYQVAFDGLYQEADRFVNKLSEMYGLDESWVTKTTGIFRQLANAMNVSTETGNKLSMLLTQMSIDISSLYNVDIERASSVLQSAMAGQTKPVRGTTGGDITMATLQQTLDTLGIDRYIGNLSYAEKRLITIVSLTQQLSEATNDFGRTIESPANQTRVLSEQWEKFTRSLGNLFLPLLGKILPYLNAILMTLTEIINIFASLLGFNLGDYDYFAGTVDSVLDLEESLNGASASAEKLKSGLRGFDKLNVITTPSSGGASAGASSGIDPDILDAFNDAFDEYNSKLTDVEMKATRIRDSIMEWLGFTKEIDPLTGDISFKYQGIGTTLKNIVSWYNDLNAVAKIFIGLGLYKILSNIINAFSKLKIIKTVTTNFKNFRTILSKVTGRGGFETLVSNMNSTLKTSDKLKLSIASLITTATGISVLTSAFDSISESGLTLSNSLQTIIGFVLTATGVFATLTSAMTIFGVTMSGIATGGLSLLITGLIGLVTWFSSNKTESEKLKEKLDELDESMQRVKDTANEQVAVTEAQTNRAKEVVESLKDYIDANGNIISSTVLVSEKIKTLNDLLGTEYTVTGNTITKNGEKITSYQDLQKEIDNYCAKLRAQTYQEAYKEVYLESLKQQVELQDMLVLKEKELTESLADAMQQEGMTTDQWKDNNKDLISDYETLNQKLDGYIKQADNYEQASYLASIGKYDDAITLFTKTEKGVYKSLEQLLSDAKYQTEDYVTNASTLFNKLNIRTTLQIDVDDSKLRQFSKNKLTIDDRVVKFSYTPVGGWAKGGLPPVGQLFVANERGAELIGHIGGQTFVANQNQMLDLVKGELASAKGMNNATFIIQVGDEEVARHVINNMQDMAKANGKPFTIGG